MANIALVLDVALRAAGLNINGVSIGKIADKATWRVDWIGVPTAAQMAAAVSIIKGLDPTTVADPPSEVDLLKARVAALEATTATLQTTTEALSAAAPAALAKVP